MQAAQMVKLAFRIVRMVAGVLLIVVGIAGLFLPILQGVLLIALGLWVLSLDFPPARRLRDWAAERVQRERAKLAERRARRRARRKPPEQP